MEKLDRKTDQYLKKWAGLPRCATPAVLHLNTALNVKKISTLYYETHAVTHCSSRLKGDKKVNLVIDNRLERESQYVRTKSVTVISEQTYQSALNCNMVQGEIPTHPSEIVISTEPVLTPPSTEPSHTFISEVKNDAKTRVILEDKEATYNHVRTLVKQGQILELTYLEQNDATWKSYIYNLPRGTMKFLLNAQLDTLPTKANLRLWGKRTNENCFCGQKQTLNHILNCCRKALEDGRFTFRHDNIVNYIAKCLDREKFSVYADIEGSQTAAGGTIPPEVMVTNLKPDLVVIDRKKIIS